MFLKLEILFSNHPFIRHYKELLNPTKILDQNFFSSLSVCNVFVMVKEVNMFVQVGFLVRICKMCVESVQSEMRVPVIGTKN